MEVPANATNIAADLYIVSDNAYIAKTGNTIIGSAGFSPLESESFGTSTNNPAGVIFFIEYSWDVPNYE